MRFYENTEAEYERIQNCVRKFGWTSDHNLDWYLECITSDDGKPVFVEFDDDGSGLLTYKHPSEWHIWSDPLSDKNLAADRIFEFSSFVLNDQIKEVWCLDVSDSIRPALIEKGGLKIGEIDYSLFWPVLDMNKYDPNLSGNHFKKTRNAKNKFYREHKVEVVSPDKVRKEDLRKIVDDWKIIASQKQEIKDIYELKYHKAIDNGFKAFLTARILVVDSRPVGFNAGYEVPNTPGRFAGVVGIHDYSLPDLGTVLWLEDLEWIKKADYKELDMQGSEDDGSLKSKMQFNPVIERKTDSFPIYRIEK